MLTLEEVKKLAVLARIELSDEEAEALRADLSSVLDYVDELKSIDVSGLEIVSQVTGLENVKREDVPVLCEYREEIMANAPARKDNFYKVKTIL